MFLFLHYQLNATSLLERPQWNKSFASCFDIPDVYFYLIFFIWFQVVASFSPAKQYVVSNMRTLNQYSLHSFLSCIFCLLQQILTYLVIQSRWTWQPYTTKINPNNKILLQVKFQTRQISRENIRCTLFKSLSTRMIKILRDKKLQ